MTDIEAEQQRLANIAYRERMEKERLEREQTEEYKQSYKETEAYYRGCY